MPDSSDLTRIISHNRGGAGNLHRPTPSTDTDPTIPHLTSPVYTTGRGGQGNMAVNRDAEAARRAQDVEISEGEVEGLAAGKVVVAGRGGRGNVVKEGEGEKEEEGGKGEELEEGKRKRESWVGRLKAKLGV